MRKVAAWCSSCCLWLSPHLSCLRSAISTLLAGQYLGFLQAKIRLLDESGQVATAILAGLRSTLRERLGVEYDAVLARGQTLDDIGDVFELVVSAPA